RGPDDRANHLRDDVGNEEARRESSSACQSDRHCRIEMTPRDMSDGIGHREHGEAESERHAEYSNSHLGNAGSDHRTAATAKRQPKGADCLGSVFIAVHTTLPQFSPSLRAIIAAILNGP